MQYAIWNRHPDSVLEKSDQIKIRFSDKDRLPDYAIKFPEKTFILHIPKEESDNINWQLYNSLSKEIKLIFCIENLGLVNQCHKNNIAWYWAYPIFTYYDLNRLIKLKPCYLSLGAPLSFSLEKVYKQGRIPIRLSANGTYDNYIPSSENIFSSWIRPEDVEYYEKYVAVLEFATEELKREATLLHVYKEEKTWPGNLNLLITNLGFNIDNRSIDEELGQRRMNCGQRCMSGGACRLCETCFKLGNSIRDLHYKKLKEN